VQQLDGLKNNIFTYINNYLQRATRTGSDGILESSRSKLPLIYRYWYTCWICELVIIIGYRTLSAIVMSTKR